MLLFLIIFSGSTSSMAEDFDVDTLNLSNDLMDNDIFFSTDYSFLDYGIKVMAANEKYLWAAGNEDMSTLYRSSDYGDTWEKVHTFEATIQGMHITPSGVFLVSTSNNRWKKECKGKLWRSEDNGQTFNLSLELNAGAAINWNIASDSEGFVFVSEYGYKDKPNNARHIYRSKDSGITWDIVYAPEETEGYHNHVIIINKNDSNTIYQSIGDNVKGVIKSTDRGQTWEKIMSGIHPTSALQIDNNIFWGLDNWPKSGILKYNLDDESVNYSFIAPKPFSGSIYDMMYANGVIYAGLLSYEYNDWDGSIFTSKNKGLTWELFAKCPKYQNTGVGFYKFTTLGDYGFVWVSLPIKTKNNLHKYQGTIRFKLVESVNS